MSLEVNETIELNARNGLMEGIEFSTTITDNMQKLAGEATANLDEKPHIAGPKKAINPNHHMAPFKLRVPALSSTELGQMFAKFEAEYGDVEINIPEFTTPQETDEISVGTPDSIADTLFTDDNMSEPVTPASTVDMPVSCSYIEKTDGNGFNSEIAKESKAGEKNDRPTTSRKSPAFAFGAGDSSDEEVDDAEGDDTEAEDTEAEDTEAEDTEAEDTEAEDTEAEDRPTTARKGPFKTTARKSPVAVPVAEVDDMKDVQMDCTDTEDEPVGRSTQKHPQIARKGPVINNDSFEITISDDHSIDTESPQDITSSSVPAGKTPASYISDQVSDSDSDSEDEQVAEEWRILMAMEAVKRWTEYIQQLYRERAQKTSSSSIKLKEESIERAKANRQRKLEEIDQDLDDNEYQKEEILKQVVEINDKIYKLWTSRKPDSGWALYEAVYERVDALCFERADLLESIGESDIMAKLYCFAPFHARNSGKTVVTKKPTPEPVKPPTLKPSVPAVAKKDNANITRKTVVAKKPNPKPATLPTPKSSVPVAVKDNAKITDKTVVGKESIPKPVTLSTPKPNVPVAAKENVNITGKMVVAKESTPKPVTLPTTKPSVPVTVKDNTSIAKDSLDKMDIDEDDSLFGGSDGECDSLFGGKNDEHDSLFGGSEGYDDSLFGGNDETEQPAEYVAIAPPTKQATIESLARQEDMAKPTVEKPIAESPIRQEIVAPKIQPAAAQLDIHKIISQPEAQPAIAATQNQQAVEETQVAPFIPEPEIQHAFMNTQRTVCNDSVDQLPGMTTQESAPTVCDQHNSQSHPTTFDDYINDLLSTDFQYDNFNDDPFSMDPFFNTALDENNAHDLEGFHMDWDALCSGASNGASQQFDLNAINMPTLPEFDQQFDLSAINMPTLPEFDQQIGHTATSIPEFNEPDSNIRDMAVSFAEFAESCLQMDQPATNASAPNESVMQSNNTAADIETAQNTMQTEQAVPKIHASSETSLHNDLTMGDAHAPLQSAQQQANYNVNLTSGSGESSQHAMPAVIDHQPIQQFTQAPKTQPSQQHNTLMPAANIVPDQGTQATPTKKKRAQRKKKVEKPTLTPLPAPSPKDFADFQRDALRAQQQGQAVQLPNADNDAPNNYLSTEWVQLGYQSPPNQLLPQQMAVLSTTAEDFRRKASSAIAHAAEATQGVQSTQGYYPPHNTQAPQPIQQPVQQPIQQPIQQPVQQPIQQPVQQPVQYRTAMMYDTQAYQGGQVCQTTQTSLGGLLGRAPANAITVPAPNFAPVDSPSPSSSISSTLDPDGKRQGSGRPPMTEQHLKRPRKRQLKRVYEPHEYAVPTGKPAPYKRRKNSGQAATTVSGSPEQEGDMQYSASPQASLGLGTSAKAFVKNRPAKKTGTTSQARRNSKITEQPSSSSPVAPGPPHSTHDQTVQNPTPSPRQYRTLAMKSQASAHNSPGTEAPSITGGASIPFVDAPTATNNDFQQMVPHIQQQMAMNHGFQTPTPGMEQQNPINNNFQTPMHGMEQQNPINNNFQTPTHGMEQQTPINNDLQMPTPSMTQQTPINNGFQRLIPQTHPQVTMGNGMMETAPKLQEQTAMGTIQSISQENMMLQNMISQNFERMNEMCQNGMGTGNMVYQSLMQQNGMLQNQIQQNFQRMSAVNQYGS